MLSRSYNFDNLGTLCARSIEDIVRCFEVSGWWRRKDESSRVLLAVVGALCAGRRFALWRQPHKQPTIEWARPPTFKCKAHSSSQNQLFTVLHYTTQLVSYFASLSMCRSSNAPTMTQQASSPKYDTILLMVLVFANVSLVNGNVFYSGLCENSFVLWILTIQTNSTEIE